ncbi:hypothetical protein GCM10011399_37760 [Subtercola lobariae]|uniref:NADH:flavin oxidoreductase/NADH oxidase N-terminal domain-containing protein n=3 Tax=Subtercola lobariae TaxID=1588641 RepID=A0A917BHF4_9MICO|nr:hypothetical protein GCM10011399_37760 [Subtercola lobariae]
MGTEVTTYDHLFTPIVVGTVRLRNRMMMGSMHIGLEDTEDGFERMAAFYSERVRGGVDLIVSGEISPDEAGRPWAGGAAMITADDVNNHAKIVEAVHAEGGHILMQLLAGVEYLGIDDTGVHIEHLGRESVVAADTVVLCTGQVSQRELADHARLRGLTWHVIGGADVAHELDAKRAIRQGVELVASL